MKIDISADEAKTLFAMFDRVRYSWGMVEEHDALMERLEGELGRNEEDNIPYPYKEVQHEDNPTTL